MGIRPTGEARPVTPRLFGRTRANRSQAFERDPRVKDGHLLQHRIQGNGTVGAAARPRR